MYIFFLKCCTNFDIEQVEQAKQILKSNQVQSITKQYSDAQPFQLSYDSAFASIGYANYDVLKAQEEMENLFQKQWKNGMLPHIIFDQYVDNHFLDQGFWQSSIVQPDLSPNFIETSGIVSAPIHPITVEKIFNNSKDKPKEFVTNIYPKLKKWMQYLYNERDPENDGLVYIRHPWESYIDNSSFWDDSLKNIPDFDSSDLPFNKRIQYEKINSQNPQYKKLLWLADCHRGNNYIEQQIQFNCLFLAEDVLFNTILARSDISMYNLAKYLQESGEIDSEDQNYWKDKYQQTINGLNNKLYDNDQKIYFNYDVSNQKYFDIKISGGLTPLWATKKFSEQLISTIKNDFCMDQIIENQKCIPVPLISQENFYIDYYNQSQYILISINWIIIQSLIDSDQGLAFQLKEITGNLLKQNHFGQFFDSNNGSYFGHNNFTQSAALYIDLSKKRIFIVYNLQQLIKPLTYYQKQIILSILIILLVKGFIFWIFRLKIEKQQEKLLYQNQEKQQPIQLNEDDSNL